MTEFRSALHGMHDCIENCTACHNLCIETIAYCQSKGGLHANPEHLALLSVCADICGTSAKAMLSNARVHVYTCAACAQVCLACAQSCAALGEDDARLRACAAACANCSRSCAEMAHLPSVRAA